MQASWVRMFADGQEVPVRVLNDGLSLPDEKSKPVSTRFRIGWDTGGASFRGRFDEIGVWPRAFTAAEVEALFEARALPYAIARNREGRATAVELEWLKDAALRRTDPSFAKDRARLIESAGGVAVAATQRADSDGDGRDGHSAGDTHSAPRRL